MGRLLSEKQKDRVADVVIRVGGILVILVVAAIVANIGLQALPLFLPASAGEPVALAAPPGVLAVGNDPRREFPWALAVDGRVHFLGPAFLNPLELSAVPLAAADHEIHGLLTVLDHAGTLQVGRLRYSDRWQDGQRTTTASWRESAEPLSLPGLEAGAAEGPEATVPATWVGASANSDADGNLLAAAWDADGRLSLARWDNEEESWTPERVPATREVRQVAVAEGLDQVAVLERDGTLHVYQWGTRIELALEGLPSPVARVRFLIGGGTLVAAHEDGSISIVLTIPRVEVTNRGAEVVAVAGGRLAPGESVIVADDEIGRKLAALENVVLAQAPPVARVIRQLPPVEGRPLEIAPSARRRVFLVSSSSGAIGLYHSTSGRRLVQEQWFEDAVSTAALDPKGDGLMLATTSQVLMVPVDNPHPETSLRTLFLPTWYEGYAAPKLVWQSTGGSDAFEPKMSLWPLIFGTLKATFYALLFAVPLALLAAVYVSQLAPEWVQSTVKPAIELMAAVPSVVVGFLAALWLAPRLEAALLPSLLALMVVPLSIAVALVLWRVLPFGWRRALPEGSELVLLCLVAAALLYLDFLLAGPLERGLFGGDFQRFLFTEWGIRYDQRNSLVVGLALGFAVIPVIFTIAEDACSAVPRSLVAASRALGATRWQTAVRLVVPAASPGLFAAVMLGLGRAVGETMIVLMAAGNTPVLDLSAFNGMRTMSAAIAVEIPEAPVGGTLFRVLFLTGILLFAFTLVLSTAADLVGAYLRKRYARY